MSNLDAARHTEGLSHACMGGGCGGGGCRVLLRVSSSRLLIECMRSDHMPDSRHLGQGFEYRPSLVLQCELHFSTIHHVELTSSGADFCGCYIRAPAAPGTLPRVFYNATGQKCQDVRSCLPTLEFEDAPPTVRSQHRAPTYEYQVIRLLHPPGTAMRQRKTLFWPPFLSCVSAMPAMPAMHG